MFHFENFLVFKVRDTKIGMLSRWKKVSPLDFQQYNHFKYQKICLCVRMLVLEWKERAFIEKVNSRCFCWFPAAILVDSFCPPIWRLHTKLYKGAWNVSANYSQTMVHKDLRLGKIVYTLVFYNIHFLGFFHWTVSNLRDSESDLKEANGDVPLDGVAFSRLVWL